MHRPDPALTPDATTPGACPRDCSCTTCKASANPALHSKLGFPIEGTQAPREESKSSGAIPGIAESLLLTAKGFRSLTIVLQARVGAIPEEREADFRLEEVASLEAVERLSAAWSTAKNALSRLQSMMTAIVDCTTMVHGQQTTQTALDLGRAEAAGSCECSGCGPRRSAAVDVAMASATKAAKS